MPKISVPECFIIGMFYWKSYTFEVLGQVEFHRSISIISRAINLL